MDENKKEIVPEATPSANNKKENKILAFLLDKKYYVGLALLVLVVMAWSTFRIKSLQSNFNNEKETIIHSYELKLDSLNIDRMQLTATTLSWAIRGELLRNNKEQINQYFNEFVKTPGIIKLQLINSEDGLIEISTDKKDEGIKTNKYANINNQVVESDSVQSTIITPITGLNNKIGIFTITIKNLKN